VATLEGKRRTDDMRARFRRFSAVDSQRVAEGTLLFAVANTETLEVAADIREGDWQVVTQRVT
jgi:hypothetical protein